MEKNFGKINVDVFGTKIAFTKQSGTPCMKLMNHTNYGFCILIYLSLSSS